MGGENFAAAEVSLNVLVSLRYTAGDQIERSLAVLLERAGYRVFRHDLTEDPLKRARSAIEFASTGMQLVTHASVTQKPEPRPGSFRPELFFELADEIARQSAAIVLWSREYREGFWSQLELTMLLAMVKPIVIVRIDDEPLPDSLRAAASTGKLSVFELGKDFRPSQVTAALDPLLHDPGVPAHIGTHRDRTTTLDFARIRHPLLGDFEIATSLVKFRTTRQIVPLVGLVDDSPILGLPWATSVDHCTRLSCKSRTHRYRLPSEVEWEFAIRAGSVDLEVERGVNAWGIESPPREIGEWCADRVFHVEVGGRTSLVSPRRENRAVRGLRHLRDPNKFAPSYPGAFPAGLGTDKIGFRVVREAGFTVP